MQGIHELLAPHRFSLWGCNLEHVPQLVPAEKNRPFDQNTAPFFPFPNPTNIMVDLNLHPDADPEEFLPQLSFRKLVQASVHTDRSSRTHVVKAVQRYGRNTMLHRVTTSSRLWTALVGFSTGPGPVPMPPDGVNDPLPEGQEHLNTYRQEAVEALPVPTLEQQLKPIYNLWSWYLMHLSTTCPLVNTEPAIHDEMHRQLLHLINQIMESRYGNFHTVITDEVTEVSPPYWSRHVERHHVNCVTKAGLPNFLLYHKGNPKGQCAMAEFKTWWSYDSSDLFDLLSNQFLPGGAVQWGNMSDENEILKQIWSEMHKFDVQFGFWTNGRVIVGILDTTDYTVPRNLRQHELTFSKIQHMGSENIIYQGIAGLCLASVEYARLPTPQEKLAFINNLCPEAWREVPGQAQESFDEDDDE